ncbi:MAG: hypothetical protein ACR2KK_18130 [Acidimicrobiales bacterium]
MQHRLYSKRDRLVGCIYVIHGDEAQVKPPHLVSRILRPVGTNARLVSEELGSQPDGGVQVAPLPVPGLEPKRLDFQNRQ